jgi:hypothetical protein
MSVRPLVVAAALVGTCLAAFVVAALAFASGNRVSAVVTLQIAPRGLGTVSVQPADKNSVSECEANEGQDSCVLTYDRGQRVTLSASSDAGRTLTSWSTPDCPGSGVCSLSLDDDATSIVALFNPLRLAVILSSPDSGVVSTDPAGTPCGDEQPGNADQCFKFPPGTQVKVTVASNAGHTFKGWNPGCEPTNAVTCTVTVEDEPTWVGARFDGDDPPQLPTTISVQFQLKRGGSGTGRVSGTDLDCGTVCSREFGYGKSLTLTAAPDQGSVFSGWNGVCAQTQTTCTVPVGPITSIKANFDHDTSPPSSPAGLTITSTTRSGIQIAWMSSTDNVAVTGYRVYLNDATAGDTADTKYAFANLKCGHQYTLAVDATDAVGNRSTRVSIAGSTQSCKLAARVASAGIDRRGRVRTLFVKLRVNRPTSAQVRLTRQRIVVARRLYRVRPGTNNLRLTIPRRLKGGPYLLKVTLSNPDGGTLSLPSLGILVPRPK